MREVTFLDRFRYTVDNTMSRGAIALIGWLFVASLGLIVVFSGLVFLAQIIPADGSGSDLSLAEVIWSSTMHALDAGTIAGDQGRGSFGSPCLA